MPEKLYKVLDAQGRACHGGTGKWQLPKGKRPGKWMPAIKGDLKPCVNGYHLCRRKDLVQWLHENIYEAEYRGDRIDDDNKVVVRQARLVRRLDTWTRRTARLFACDCAERTLKRVDSPDPRSLEAVRVARRYANGEATDEELTEAKEAAWAVAREAASEAARAAARAAWAAGAAAWAAAGEAARAVARDAAWAVAREAERKWQTRRLFEYLDGKRP